MNLSYPKKSKNIKEPIISTSDNAGTPQLHLADLCQYSMGMLVRSLLDTAILLQNDWLILIDLFVSLFAFWFFFFNINISTLPTNDYIEEKEYVGSKTL